MNERREGGRERWGEKERKMKGPKRLSDKLILVLPGSRKSQQGRKTGWLSLTYPSHSLTGQMKGPARL